MRRLIPVLLCVLMLGCGSDEPVSSESAETEAAETEAESGPPEIERPYDESADAQEQIDAAVASAGNDQKRVLLMFGANWCEWCRRLDWVFQNQPEVSSVIDEGYHLVHVDVGPRGSSTNRQVAVRYGDPLSNGLPCLVVLDDEGGVAHVQETGSLEEGDHHDPALVLAFLRQWRDGQG